MKCLVFTGEGAMAANDYNVWAKDKPLTKDVIVHTHIAHSLHGGESENALVIIVFFDEKIHPNW